MRKNAPRKWIHAILDLLPLFVIPIFAININQKSVEPISIEVGGYKYQNRYQTNEVNSVDDLIEGNIYKFEMSIDVSDYSGPTYLNDYSSITIIEYDIDKLISYIENNKRQISYSKYDIFILENVDYIEFQIEPNKLQVIADTVDDDSSLDVSSEVNLARTDFVIKFYFIYTSIDSVNTLPISNTYVSDYNPIDYVYNPSIVYDNTDVGSQFLYSIYKPVNDYFNFNNLFNMNDVWNWIQLNLFSGSAPLPVFIVWNIILYEFFIDLIFLMYSVFMFIIDFATNCLERPFNKVR